MDRFGIEHAVRLRMADRLGVPLEKRKLVVGVRADRSQRHHEFDGVSQDGQTVIEIKTNKLNSTPGKPKGRYDSAIKPALTLDLYMLSRIRAGTKLLVLTDRPLFEVCSPDMDGLLTHDSRIVHCPTD
jgi:hypothetical protein